MDKNITAQQIEDMALDARVPITAVLERSGVSRSAFYKWKRDESNMLPLTRARLVDAVSDLKKERTQ